MGCFGRGLLSYAFFANSFCLGSFFVADSFCHAFFWSQIHGDWARGIGRRSLFCKLAIRRLGTGLLRGGRMSADCHLQKLPIATPLSIPIESITDCLRNFEGRQSAYHPAAAKQAEFPSAAHPIAHI